MFVAGEGEREREREKEMKKNVYGNERFSAGWVGMLKRESAKLFICSILINSYTLTAPHRGQAAKG